MKTLCVLLAACVLSVAVAACGESSPAITAPDGARFYGGHTAGSGNKSDSTTVASSSGATTESDSTITARGGSSFGGGN